MLTDGRVKPSEYRAVAAVELVALVSQDRQELTVLGRSTGWTAEVSAGADAVLVLHEIGIAIPLREIYG